MRDWECGMKWIESVICSQQDSLIFIDFVAFFVDCDGVCCSMFLLLFYVLLNFEDRMFSALSRYDILNILRSHAVCESITHLCALYGNVIAFTCAIWVILCVTVWPFSHKMPERQKGRAITKYFQCVCMPANGYIQKHMTLHDIYLYFQDQWS